MKNEVSWKWTQKWLEEKKEIEGNFHLFSSSKWIIYHSFIHSCIYSANIFEQQLHARQCAKQKETVLSFMETAFCWEDG